MTQFATGWYPDPDDEGARRYWDGESWSAPLSIEPAPAAAAAVAEPAPKADWQIRAEERGTAIAPTCSVGPCQFGRVPGTLYCAKHGPMGSRPASKGASRPGASAIKCPHCDVTGKVSSRQVKQKKGVSGGKLTGAVLTGGLSMLGTGLSRKEKVTELRCGHCGTVWHV